MDPNQNTPPNARNREYDPFALNTTPRQFPQVESPRGGFVNLLNAGSPIPHQPLFQHQVPPFVHYQQPQFQSAFSFQQPFIPQHHQMHQQSEPDSPDFVPETQMVPEPEPSQAKKKGKKKGKQPQQQQQQQQEPTINRENWTKDEHVNLAKSWLAVSHNETQGNSQSKESFWKQVLEDFHQRSRSNKRRPDQITSKWREIRLKVGAFCGIFHNLDKINRASGSNDFDVYTAACEQYKAIHGNNKAFPFQEVWMVLKDSEKWKEHLESENATSSGSKRRRNEDRGHSQQSDGRTFIDINDEPADEQQPLHRRPMGRDRAKKAGSSSRQSESGVIDHFGPQFERYVELQSQKVESLTRVEQEAIASHRAKKEKFEAEKLQADMNLLKMRAAEFEDDEDLQIFRAMKESVRTKYRRN